jgi:gamma-glutamyltranspeptidase/glutathione hydrolase
MRVTDPDGRLRIEARIRADVRAALAARGHAVDVVSERAYVMGHAHALTVQAGPDGRLLAGGADPRGEGLALGY